MGPNYREPQTISISKALIEITFALDTCIEAMALKTKHTNSKFKPWKEKVLGMVKRKITELKQNVKLKQKKTVLSDPDAKWHLKKLLRKSVIVILIKHQTILHLYV